MMVVSDLEDIFVPLLDGFLCLPQDSRGVINRLVDLIKIFQVIFLCLVYLIKFHKHFQIHKKQKQF
jgi:hypothetical protein